MKKYGFKAYHKCKVQKMLDEQWKGVWSVQGCSLVFMGEEWGMTESGERSSILISVPKSLFMANRKCLEYS